MADYFTPPPARRATRNSPPIGEIVQNGDSQEIILRLAGDYITAFTRKIDLGRFMNVPVLQIRGQCRAHHLRLILEHSTGEESKSLSETLDTNAEYQWVGRWPRVMRNHWCGEWAKKEPPGRYRVR